jgi:ubiquinone/menaquinone biosynthesis C-methylase UbiE
LSDLDPTRQYYDEFAPSYEAQRRPADPSGYHAMIDDLEVGITKRYASGRDLLEVGCGTGLLLERFGSFTRTAAGIDLSPKMLERAKARGLDVRVGSATDLPFEDESFDVTCSFKVLAHVENIGAALSEMARVTRSGGMILAELYNPISFRGLLKRIGPPGKISRFTKEDAVYTRFDPPWVVPRLLPARTRLERAYGVRIVTPAASALRVPVVRRLLPPLERFLSATPAAFFAGFYVAAVRKL